MSYRRNIMGGMNPNATSSLHRCAIAFCSNTAVAEGVCDLHLSSGGGSHLQTRTPLVVPNELSHRGGFRHPDGYLSTPPAVSGYGVDPSDRFRSSVSSIQLPHRDMKRQKLGVDGNMERSTMVMDRGDNLRTTMTKPYPPLTQESLSQMTNRMKFSNGPVTVPSAYDDNPYLQQTRPPQGSTNGSIISESEHSGEGAGDKESNLRRERNRIAARKSRQRKLDRISNLEEEKMRLEQHRDMLVQEIRSLEKKDSGAISSAVSTMSDKEYAQLQHTRMQIIKAVEDAYNNGNIYSTLGYFREDSIVSGPQNSSVHLRGRDALILDYVCTKYLFHDIHLQHVKVDSGGPRSQHFRVHWIFSGIVKTAGVSMNKEFLELIDSVKGKRVEIEGVSNYSFSGEKIVYIHRTADQAKFLSSLVNLSKGL